MPAAAFADRVVELDRLVHDLAAAQKVFLISPRRYGKSSLIRLALAAMARRGLITVDVTVSSFSSYVAFLEGYARALAAAETRAERARTSMRWLRESISSTRVDIAPDLRIVREGDWPGPGPKIAFPNARTDRRVGQRPTPKELSSSLSTSSRPLPASTEDRLSTRCARRCSASAMSATCSPDRSRA